MMELNGVAESRTADPSVGERLLYPLSYRAEEDNVVSNNQY